MKTLEEMQQEKRAALAAEAKEIVAKAEAEGRDLTADETDKVIDAGKTVRSLDEVIDATKAVTRSADIPSVRVKSEPLTYSKHGSNSYFRDAAMLAFHRSGADIKGAEDIAARLARHGREAEVEKRAGDTGDTAGGTFVPPLWLLDEYVGVQRAGRATANLARQMSLPSGTDSINIPTITTGNVTAVQATENSAATTRDMATGSTTADVTTIAGTYDFSLQLLEQSALSGGWDQLVFNDLVADKNRALDVLVLSGSGASNQPWGLSTIAGTTVFASSTSSTTAQNQIFAGVADAINRVATTRFQTPTVLVMHPRRFYWLASRLDTVGRPVINTDAAAAASLLATMGLPAAEGAVGVMLGLPIVIDANVPTTAGTSEDRIHVWRPNDAILMEGAPRFEVFRTIGGATTDSLTARARLYSYAAFTARFATSVALVGGTALSSPTF